MNPFLKGTKGRFLVGKSAEPDSFAISKNDFQPEHHVCDPAVARHAVADTAFVQHGTYHNRRTVGSKVGQHQAMLPQGMMNGVDARTTLRDHILKGWVDFQDFVHAEHVEENATLERRADAHTHPAFSDDGDLMLVGKLENLGNGVITASIRFDTYDDVRQCPISAVSKGVLIIDFVDGIRRNESWADDLFELFNNLVQRWHESETLGGNK